MASHRPARHTPCKEVVENPVSFPELLRCVAVQSISRKLMSVEALLEYRRQTCKDDALLSVSYTEIYRDEVYDLLVDRDTVGHTMMTFVLVWELTFVIICP